ncbi:protein involved in detoxification of methylglyoxal [Escherichia coli]|uniref:Protein involved in detoxification of methylglyoxal n=1 Tax=Escherichia coli TaxID=562 RepID=A0A3S4MJR5_ECOLX|nr:protein involved in detoxification of methylglyoxal [Escherichia coli]
MFKPRICSWIGLLPLFMLSLPVQAELRCVANAVDIEPFFSAATAEDKQQVEQAINSSVNLVPFGLSASDWKVHRGDLVVDGNIESNQKLIVLGNLTVKGNISTFSLSNPWIILGNVTATNIVTDSPLLITGSINASGLVFIDSYYDNPSTIKGSINARGIFINDIIAPVVVSSTNSEFMVRAGDKNDTENVKKALTIINPDAYYWGLINDEDALKEIFKRSNIRIAGNVCNQMKKEALFRPKPSPELVQELQMLDEGKVAAFEGRDIATFDLAIMRTLPRLKGISANLRKQLINSNDEQTIESMARYMPDNEILELTDQQLGYQPVVLGLLNREPLSVEIMTRISHLPDGAGPLNLALRENLPLDIVMTLAKRDWVIEGLYKDAWLLPESIIDGYIRSDDPTIRQVGAGGQLTYNQAMQLAKDSSKNVVTNLAFKLAEMKHHGQLLRMTPQESDKIAVYLYQKFENDDDLIGTLFLALPDNLQFNFVKKDGEKIPCLLLLSGYADNSL